MAARIVHLDVNESGGWRRVASFDLDQFEDGALEQAAQALLELSNNQKIKGRIIAPGDTAPLVLWTRTDGWREWRTPA